MPETETLTLPLLPLTTGVVLPQMVVTLAIESPEARDAAEGAPATDRRVLLVPARRHRVRHRRHHRPHRERGRPAGRRTGHGPPRPGPCPRGHTRARRTPRRLGQRRARQRDRRPSPAGRGELAREYRAVVRGIAERLGSPRFADALQGVDDIGALADTAGWSPDLSVERKVELLETLDPEARLEKALRVGARRARRARGVGPDPSAGQ